MELQEIDVFIEKNELKEIPPLMTGEQIREGWVIMGHEVRSIAPCPENREQLSDILDVVVLPKKGRLSAQDKEIEQSEEFIESRRKHSAVESCINALENHGLDRCLDHGLDGFKRYIALSVLARNIQILGHLIKQKELNRHKRKKAA